VAVAGAKAEAPAPGLAGSARASGLTAPAWVCCPSFASVLLLGPLATLGDVGEVPRSSEKVTLGPLPAATGDAAPTQVPAALCDPDSSADSTEEAAEAETMRTGCWPPLSAPLFQGMTGEKSGAPSCWPLTEGLRAAGPPVSAPVHVCTVGMTGQGWWFEVLVPLGSEVMRRRVYLLHRRAGL
jgi:hypothetical protein